jgi:AraC family transcriptional regulator, exoenzyme S synthesis regulatory protein ExsA
MPSENLLELKFKEMLFNVLSEPENSSLLAYMIRIAEQQKILLWDVMESNFMYNLSTTEFARIAGRSVASFKREFKEYYNTTPGRWLTKKRLEYAKYMLLTSKRGIGEIIYDSGFENVSHFSRIFKDNYGETPHHFRKKQAVGSNLNNCPAWHGITYSIGYQKESIPDDNDFLKTLFLIY